MSVAAMLSSRADRVPALALPSGLCGQRASTSLALSSGAATPTASLPSCTPGTTKHSTMYRTAHLQPAQLPYCGRFGALLLLVDPNGLIPNQRVGTSPPRHKSQAVAPIHRCFSLANPANATSRLLTETAECPECVVAEWQSGQRSRHLGSLFSFPKITSDIHVRSCRTTNARRSMRSRVIWQDGVCSPAGENTDCTKIIPRFADAKPVMANGALLLMMRLRAPANSLAFAFAQHPDSRLLLATEGWQMASRISCRIALPLQPATRAQLRTVTSRDSFLAISSLQQIHIDARCSQQLTSKKRGTAPALSRRCRQQVATSPKGDPRLRTFCEPRLVACSRTWPLRSTHSRRQAGAPFPPSIRVHFSSLSSSTA